MSYLMKILTTFAMSMVPVVELRGGIPYGLSQGLEWPLVYLIAVVGNLLPIPFILLFVRRILQWMKRYERLGRIAGRLEARAAKRSDRVRRSEIIGLCMFVAIPLPGTGADGYAAEKGAAVHHRGRPDRRSDRHGRDPSRHPRAEFSGRLRPVRLQPPDLPEKATPDPKWIRGRCVLRGLCAPGQCCSPCCSAPAPTAAGCFSSGASAALR